MCYVSAEAELLVYSHVTKNNDDDNDATAAADDDDDADW